MKLSLEAGQPGFALPLEIQSMSPSGLVVLTSSQPPHELDERLLAHPDHENEVLTFLLEKDGQQTTLQANLVWLELSKEETQPRLELIVDTGDQPGWWEVHTALSGE
jgi:hypothetical protein